MSLERTISDLARRVPWDVAQIIFARAALEKGHGWERTQHRYKSVKGTQPQQAALTDALKEHLLAGEKLVRFYAPSVTDMKALRSAVATLPQASNDFSKAYPNLATQAQIDANFPQKHSLIAVEKRASGTALVFSSTRAIRLREEINTAALQGAAAQALARYDEVVAYTKVRFQAVDVVWIPDRGRFVDVRIDCPKGMGLDVGAWVQNQLHAIMHQLIGADRLGPPLNLFPLIQQLYGTANEGIVVELAFGTTTASLKHERMRRAGACLRTETYHVGGKAALQTDIEPYRLAVRWLRRQGNAFSRPEIGLYGTSKSAHGVAPSLTEATIRHCVDTDDFDHVRMRVRAVLNKGSTNPI
jgi:hypothetical protein